MAAANVRRRGVGSPDPLRAQLRPPNPGTPKKDPKKCLSFFRFLSLFFRGNAASEGLLMLREPA